MPPKAIIPNPDGGPHHGPTTHLLIPKHLSSFGLKAMTLFAQPMVLMMQCIEWGIPQEIFQLSTDDLDMLDILSQDQAAVMAKTPENEKARLPLVLYQNGIVPSPDMMKQWSLREQLFYFLHGKDHFSRLYLRHITTHGITIVPTPILISTRVHGVNDEDYLDQTSLSTLFTSLTTSPLALPTFPTHLKIDSSIPTKSFWNLVNSILKKIPDGLARYLASSNSLSIFSIPKSEYKFYIQCCWHGEWKWGKFLFRKLKLYELGHTWLQYGFDDSKNKTDNNNNDGVSFVSRVKSLARARVIKARRTNEQNGSIKAKSFLKNRNPWFPPPNRGYVYNPARFAGLYTYPPNIHKQIQQQQEQQENQSNAKIVALSTSEKSSGTQSDGSSVHSIALSVASQPFVPARKALPNQQNTPNQQPQNNRQQQRSQNNGRQQQQQPSHNPPYNQPIYFQPIYFQPPPFPPHPHMYPMDHPHHNQHNNQHQDQNQGHPMFDGPRPYHHPHFPVPPHIMSHQDPRMMMGPYFPHPQYPYPYPHPPQQHYFPQSQLQSPPPPLSPLPQSSALPATIAPSTTQISHPISDPRIASDPLSPLPPDSFMDLPPLSSSDATGLFDEFLQHQQKQIFSSSSSSSSLSRFSPPSSLSLSSFPLPVPPQSIIPIPLVSTTTTPSPTFTTTPTTTTKLPKPLPKLAPAPIPTLSTTSSSTKSMLPVPIRLPLPNPHQTTFPPQQHLPQPLPLPPHPLPCPVPSTHSKSSQQTLPKD